VAPERPSADDRARSRIPLDRRAPDDSSVVPLDVANQNPDAVRQYYAPRNWAGWDSLPGDTTQKQYTNLTVADPPKRYLFAVVAFDEAGAYSPIFSRNSNMTLFKVTFAGVQLPRIGIFNDFFLYEYDQGSYRPGDPNQVVHVQVPAAKPGHPADRLALNWYAASPIGAPIRSYRWAVDITNLEDETRARTRARTSRTGARRARSSHRAGSAPTSAARPICS
jgi:hypothetical protein